MTERTLILRLAGPLQSWGEESKFNARGTLAYPSYSGLLGLCRAALGYGRDNDTGLADLRALGVVLRGDSPGTVLRDYHSINPPRGGVGAWIVPNGKGRPWTAQKEPGTVLTERHYLTDAAFTALMTGNDSTIHRLAAALRGPHWHISLGRKACIPDFPLVLGTTSASVESLLTCIPVIDVNLRLATDEDLIRAVEVHWLTRKPASDTPDVIHFDDPRGGHPHDGYRMRTRWINRTDYTAPVVPSRRELLDWANEHLDTGYGAS